MHKRAIGQRHGAGLLGLHTAATPRIGDKILGVISHGDAQRLRRLAGQAALFAALLLPAPLLAGCGGGDPEPETPTPTVNCAAHPQACK